MPLIKVGVSDSVNYFNLDGLDYKKGIWEVYYDTRIVKSGGELDLNLIQIGLRNDYDRLNVLQYPVPIDYWENSIGAPYSDLNTLLNDLSTIVGFNSVQGNVDYTQKVDQYNTLIPGSTQGQLAYVEQPQGVKWRSVVGLGTYYPAGTYLWDGVKWVSDRNAIVDQLEDILVSLNSTVGVTWISLATGFKLDTIPTETTISGGVVRAYTYADSSIRYRFTSTDLTEDDFYENFDGTNKPTSLIVARNITI